ncbi:hypothetical protein HDU87_008180 [Geranomyces variabilis]|uniref:Methyltransferase type 11 domain-containing protein n=1 Tax=Geranomyces variabilis TaxID=109894 RepID=A0AAD5TDA8_9FUNG|nr:hypothetical protein HDU87_008180 [Geranomyces variabilis]
MAWSIDQVTKFYGEYATQYDDEIRDPDSYPAPFVIASMVLAHLAQNKEIAAAAAAAAAAADIGDSEPLRVLDLGCGTGQSSKLFFPQPLRRAIDVYGVDATPEMLEKAKKYPFRSLICQDIESPLPFLSSTHKTFDAVICVGVIDFISDPAALLTTVRNALSPSRGSCFGLTIPQSGDLNAFGSDDAVRELVEDAGFVVLKHELIFGYEDSETKEVIHYHGLLLGVK